MSNNADDPEKVRWWLWLLLVLLFLVVSILWLYMPFTWLHCFFPDIKTAQFGDRFEAVNALFAGLAFAGVIFAIILQWKELGLQRQELQDTRAEIRGQKETLEKQNFENFFFQLLTMHSEIVNSMMIHSVHVATSGLTQTASEYYGRDCFKPLFQKLRDVYEVDKEQMCASSSNPEEAKELMYHWAKDKYEEFYRDLLSSYPFFGSHHKSGLVASVLQHVSCWCEPLCHGDPQKYEGHHRSHWNVGERSLFVLSTVYRPVPV